MLVLAAVLLHLVLAALVAQEVPESLARRLRCLSLAALAVPALLVLVAEVQQVVLVVQVLVAPSLELARTCTDLALVSAVCHLRACTSGNSTKCLRMIRVLRSYAMPQRLSQRRVQGLSLIHI